MKDMKKLFVSFGVVCFTASVALSAPSPCTQKVEAYAHPTLFGTQTQQLTDTTTNYTIGGKMVKSKDRLGMEKKANVLTNAWARDVLDLIREKTNSEVFNPKMPILRSELAVLYAEGLSIPQTGKKYAYTDIANGYWAADWIYRALSEGVMIGYPNKTFRPDQPVTKAEIFATIATLIEVEPADSLAIKGQEMKNIPAWAETATKEVIASGLLNNIPDQEKLLNDEYLSKDQVAVLIGDFRQSYLYKKNGINADAKYAPTVLNIVLKERISAKHSNVGDTFTAKLTKSATVNGQAFSTKAKVKGEVVEVSRPGVKNPGYIKVKFVEIKEGDTVVAFPKTISEAEAETLKNPNILARLVGAPFSMAGRTVGVVGRSGAATVEVAANGLEQYGDNWSNAFVNTFSLHPGVGAKNVGQSFVTIGKGVYDISKLAVSGTFGVVYEFVDECVYVILPSKSNNSSLNPGEELTIVF